jgi:hypothetical protein
VEEKGSRRLHYIPEGEEGEEEEEEEVFFI